MILPEPSTSRFKKPLSLAISVIISIAYGACLTLFDSRSAQAKAERIVIHVPVYEQTTLEGLIAQAEVLISEFIHSQFRQITGAAVVEVVVVGDRNGEVTPVLVTRVSRAQWQQNPQVSAWTDYYRASFALLQRHDSAATTAIANAPLGAATIDSSSPSLALSFQLDQAYDEGRLTGLVAQEHLNFLD